MPVVRVGKDNEVIIPADVREELGIKPGDLLHAKFERVLDVPYTDEPLSPEAQASLERGLRDAEAGHTIGPFDNVADLIRKLRTPPTEDA